MFTRLDCRDSRFRHTYILKSWDYVCFTVSKLFLELRLYKELLTCLYQHHVTGNGFSEKHHLSQVESESGQFVWLDSFPKHLSICIFFLIINICHTRCNSQTYQTCCKKTFQKIEVILFIYLFFLYPLSYFFSFCFVLIRTCLSVMDLHGTPDWRTNK